MKIIRRSNFGFLFGLWLLIPLMWAAPANAGLRLCNETDYDIRYAIIYTHFPDVLKQRTTWPLKGWYNLKSGKCVRQLSGRDERLVAMAVRAVRIDHIPQLLYFPEQDGSATGIMRPLCILRDLNGDGGYKDTIEEYAPKPEDCPDNRYWQMFNLHIHVPLDTDYTFYFE